MEHNQIKTNLLDATDKSKRLTSLLFVISQALNHAKGEAVEEAEECLTIAWKLSNSVASSLSDTNKAALRSLTTFPANSPASIPASLRTPKPYPEQQTVELPASLRGEAAEQPKATDLIDEPLPNLGAIIKAAKRQLSELNPGQTIGKRIQSARESLDMSRVALACKLEVSMECIADWEEEAGPVEADYIILLSDALKCDLVWLLSGCGMMTTNEAPLAPVEVMQGVDMSTIGKRINARRIALRFSPAELEKVAGLPEGTVFLWETGKANPPSDAITKLAPILRTTNHWLLTGREIARES
ncbi:transcriptional regulator [Trabulsiella odontotermitis]|uniref:HTH cro/C1-type domain-containing protein n=1 Tax=Trabulsiella odontotermitis TaxID=379893 RepID=A0A0L0GZ81_9ENTR|nr:transcriptional regulator [Trabulsiella odontotermitis]KNC94006.1 hypothetical protein GM31_16670 [Trabulsiella odontotermitis]